MMKHKSEKRLALVMPAYNEGKVIGAVLDSLPLDHDGVRIDKVVVNDGSSDNTEEAATRSGAIVITHVLNSGSGGATTTGLTYARDNGYDYAVTIDADG